MKGQPVSGPEEARAETSVGPEASADPREGPSTTLPPGDTTTDDGREQAPRAVDETRSYRPSDRVAPDPVRPPGREWPTIAGYEILGLLGRGGMGKVYKARQVSLQRLVALKVILAGEEADAEQVARFREEARIIARMHHPNIVQIHEIGEEGGHPFIALELVEGGSLADHLRGTPMPVASAARLVETLARAVHAAHQQGVIHRDLKPANILLSPPAFLPGHAGGMDGWVPKITDFGLAKRRDVTVGLTISGAIMGTPSYMAPEQAAGRAREIGPAADIYALGVILYELITGRTPFRGSTIEILDQVRNTPPTPPRRIEPEIPADLETICLKCLYKEPERRYSSGSGLAADLRRFLEFKPIMARPVGPVRRVILWSRRNRLLLLGAIVLVVAVALTWVGAARWQDRRREEQERERIAREREWKDYQERRGRELFEKLLIEGPSTWPMPAEERLVFQNGLHDLQVRRNRASLQGNQKEIEAVDAQFRRADPLLQRLQADFTRGEIMGLPIPAVQAARTSANRMRSMNNLKQLGLAMNHHSNVYNFLPRWAIFGKDGRPLLSWRVAILPYLQQMPLYQRFRLDEPWDSPHNKGLLKYMPPVYMPGEEPPGYEPYTTYYQVFVGNGGRVGPLFDASPRFQIRNPGGCPDGTSSTLMIVEGGAAVPWTRPEDIPYDPGKPLPALGGVFKDGTVAAYADGMVKFLTRDLGDEMIRALITRNGGEPIEWTKLK